MNHFRFGSPTLAFKVHRSVIMLGYLSHRFALPFQGNIRLFTLIFFISSIVFANCLCFLAKVFRLKGR